MYLAKTTSGLIKTLSPRERLPSMASSEVDMLALEPGLCRHGKALRALLPSSHLTLISGPSSQPQHTHTYCTRDSQHSTSTLVGIVYRVQDAV